MAAAFAFILAILSTTLIDGDGNNGDRFDRDIHSASLHSSNLIHHFKAFNDFTENSVVAIEMRGTTHGLVGLTLTSVEHLTHTAFKLIQSLVVIHLALHDIKLRSAGSLLGVHLVRLTSGTKGTFLVEMVVLDFSRNSIAWVETTIGILTTLDHEVLDDAVEG